MEQNYDFRKRLDRVHKPDIRDHSRRPEAEETALDADWEIVYAGLPERGTAAHDLQDYLQIGMAISLPSAIAQARRSVRIFRRSLRVITMPMTSMEHGPTMLPRPSIAVSITSGIRMCRRTRDTPVTSAMILGLKMIFRKCRCQAPGRPAP